MFISLHRHEEIVQLKDVTIAAQDRHLYEIHKRAELLQQRLKLRDEENEKLQDGVRHLTELNMDLQEQLDAATGAQIIDDIPVEEMTPEQKIEQIEKDIQFVSNTPVYTMAQREQRRQEVARLQNVKEHIKNTLANKT